MIKLEEWIYLKDSWKEGNTTTIMVWVHWNEKSWIDALNDLKNNLEIISWKVYFIYANLEAIKQNIRFTEKNLNRCFLDGISKNSYEGKRALQIMKYLKQTDFMLDVHNTISFNNSLEVLITEHKEHAKYFPITKIITNIDNVQKWWSDGYVDSKWWKWFCLECGSINFWDKAKSYDIAKKWIVNFLKLTDNINWKLEIFNDKKKIMYMDYCYKTKTDNFIFAKDFKDFEFIKKWELIWVDWEEKIYAKFDSIIMFARKRYKAWEETFYIWHKID